MLATPAHVRRQVVGRVAQRLERARLEERGLEPRANNKVEVVLDSRKGLDDVAAARFLEACAS